MGSLWLHPRLQEPSDTSLQDAEHQSARVCDVKMPQPARRATAICRHLGRVRVVDLGKEKSDLLLHFAWYSHYSQKIADCKPWKNDEV